MTQDERITALEHFVKQLHSRQLAADALLRAFVVKTAPEVLPSVLEQYELEIDRVAARLPPKFQHRKYWEDWSEVMQGQVDNAAPATVAEQHIGKAREQHTAEEIRDEVARILNEGRTRRLEVPLPYRLAFEADPFLGGGSNWHMPRLKDTAGNEAAIGRAIMAVKAKWDLKG